VGRRLPEVPVFRYVTRRLVAYLVITAVALALGLAHYRGWR